MLPDGDFEGSNLAWSGINCGQKCVVSDSDRSSQVLRIVGDDSWLSVKHTVAVTAGQDYEISALIKTVNINRNARVSYRWYQGDNPLTAKMHFGIVSGTTPYVKYDSGVITAPQNGTYLEIMLKVNQGSGTAFFDDVSIVEASTATALADATVDSGG